MNLDYIESPYIARVRELEAERDRALRLAIWVDVLAVAAVCGWAGFLLAVFTK